MTWSEGWIYLKERPGPVDWFFFIESWVRPVTLDRHLSISPCLPRRHPNVPFKLSWIDDLDPMGSFVESFVKIEKDS